MAVGWVPLPGSADCATDPDARASHLAAELAAAERRHRRCILEAEQRRAELEQEVADLRGLVVRLICAEPSLRVLVEDELGARIWMPDVDAGAAASAQFARHLRLADQNLQLAAEVRKLRHGTEQLQAENVRLVKEQEQLALQLAGAERDRRRTEVLMAQVRADLEQHMQQSHAATKPDMLDVPTAASPSQRREAGGSELALRGASWEGEWRRWGPQAVSPQGAVVGPRAASQGTAASPRRSPRQQRRTSWGGNASGGGDGRVPSPFVRRPSRDRPPPADPPLLAPGATAGGDDAPRGGGSGAAAVVEGDGPSDGPGIDHGAAVKERADGKMAAAEAPVERRLASAAAALPPLLPLLLPCGGFEEGFVAPTAAAPGTEAEDGAAKGSQEPSPSGAESAKSWKARFSEQLLQSPIGLHDDRHLEALDILDKVCPMSPKLFEDGSSAAFFSPRRVSTGSPCPKHRRLDSRASSKMSDASMEECRAGEGRQSDASDEQPATRAAANGAGDLSASLAAASEEPPVAAASPASEQLRSPRGGSMLAMRSKIYQALKEDAALRLGVDEDLGAGEKLGDASPAGDPSGRLSRQRSPDDERARRDPAGGGATADNDEAPAMPTAAAVGLATPRMATPRLLKRSGSITSQILSPRKKPSFESLHSDSQDFGPDSEPPRDPWALVEGFFVIDAGQHGTPFVRLSWPDYLAGGRLEDAVVRKGFCPDPIIFGQPDPNGAGQQPFVFSLLETALDPQGDPSSVVYGCVCGGDVAAQVDPALPHPPQPSQLWPPKPKRSTSDPLLLRKAPAIEDLSLRRQPSTLSGSGGGGGGGETQALRYPFGVLCLLSKLPLFSFLFELLAVLREDLRLVWQLLPRVNALSASGELLSAGVDLARLCQAGGVLEVKLPRPLLCDWQDVAALCTAPVLGEAAHTAARWQAAWCLGVLLARCENLVGETLARLLACTLLEQKILLLGDVPRASPLALLLRALLWPFRWMHLFISAPPPSTLLDIPLLDAPSPLILVLTKLPQEWGYKTNFELPPEVVIGVLRQASVHIAKQLQTTGGLKGDAVKLPANRHAAFVKLVTQAKQRLKKGELTQARAAEVIQEAAEAEVQRYAKVLRSYAATWAARLRKEVVSFGDLADRERLDNQIIREASDLKAFTDWFTAGHHGESKSKEMIAFYRTLFQTQLCLNFLEAEILTQVAGIEIGSLPPPLDDVVHV